MVSDREGTIATTQPAHPYWDSARAPGDPYWQRVNDCSGQTVEVPARTIDALAAETALPGPYLLKLDVQGSELKSRGHNTKLFQPRVAGRRTMTCWSGRNASCASRCHNPPASLAARPNPHAG